MKTDTRQLMRDLQAAVMLNRPEAVDLALDSLLGLPGAASNDRMHDGMIDKVILPVGEILAGIKSPLLHPLSEHQLAVGRAVGGVALAHRFIKHHDSTSKDLRRFGNDPRTDVRQALGRALLEIGPLDPKKIFELASDWIKQPGSRLRYTALIFLPGLAPIFGTEIMFLLDPISADPEREVRGVLAETLTSLARGGMAEPVLDLLSRWSAEPEPNSWIVCRVLSASWASEHPIEVKSILQAIRSVTGESSHISNVLKALKRHGLALK